MVTDKGTLLHINETKRTRTIIDEHYYVYYVINMYEYQLKRAMERSNQNVKRGK